jgi:hypothetical protein
MITEQQSGLEIIDSMFEKYLIKYVNAHFREFENSYKVGEWFIVDVLSKLLKTRVTDKKRALLAIRLLLKDKNVEKLLKELGEYNAN